MALAICKLATIMLVMVLQHLLDRAFTGPSEAVCSTERICKLREVSVDVDDTLREAGPLDVLFILI